MQDSDLLPEDGDGKNGGTAKIIYIIFLCSVVFGLLAIVGVIIAYVYRDHAGGWVDKHFHFQIRTFWIGLLYFVVSSIATFFVIGWLLLLVSLVWWIVRCAKGLKALSPVETISQRFDLAVVTQIPKPNKVASSHDSAIGIREIYAFHQPTVTLRFRCGHCCGMQIGFRHFTCSDQPCNVRCLEV